MREHLNTVKSDSGNSRRYHHGDLREALITAAGEILAERGVGGFSLREAARRTGVSPAAPAHHFGDSRGLLTAVAARGFRMLSEALGGASDGAADERRLEALGHAYLKFATANPAIFTIMWMQDLLDQANSDYLAAGRAAFNQFERAATGADLPVATAPQSPDASLIATWSMIHGLARLMIDGALAGAAPNLPDDVVDLMPRLIHSSLSE